MRTGGEVDVDGLRALIGSLRGHLPPGANVVALGSVRARDRAEVTAGEVFPLTLASPLFFEPQWGQQARHTTPLIQIFEGQLTEHHMSSLVSVLEQAARNKVDVVLAASEIDDKILALLLINKQRGTLRTSGLLADASGSGLAALARAIGVKPGMAGRDLVVEAPGTAANLVATLNETILLLDPRTQPTAPQLGLLFIGGADAPEVRARVDAARALIAAGG